MLKKRDIGISPNEEDAMRAYITYIVLFSALGLSLIGFFLMALGQVLAGLVVLLISITVVTLSMLRISRSDW
jgi:hypothetical protein